MAENQSYSLGQIAGLLKAELRGDASVVISGLATLQAATQGQITFLANPAYARFLAQTRASAVIVHPRQASECPVDALVMDNPYLGYAALSHLFDPAPVRPAGRHASAVIAASAQVADSAYIGPHAVICDHAVVGEKVVIDSGVHVGEASIIGKGTRIRANTVIYHGVVIGEECLIQAGAVIGGDGFGFAPGATGWQKIAQIGGVRIGNRVEIGAGTTIDRGALDDTLIHDGVIIDNLVQIAHNVQIGANTAIAACAGIAGSAKIGSNCVIGGGCGIVGHIEIADGVHLTGMTMVTKGITESGLYSSGTSFGSNAQWRKSVARFWQLNDLAKKLKDVEKEVRTLHAESDSRSSSKERSQ